VVFSVMAARLRPSQLAAAVFSVAGPLQLLQPVVVAFFVAAISMVAAVNSTLQKLVVVKQLKGLLVKIAI
jgi:hypothetical protein